MRTYQGIESAKIIATDIDTRLVDNLWGLELAPVGDLPVAAVANPQRNRPGEGVQHIPNHPPHNQRLPIPVPRHLSFAQSRLLVFLVTHNRKSRSFSNNLIVHCVLKSTELSYPPMMYRWRSTGANRVTEVYEDLAMTMSGLLYTFVGNIKEERENLSTLSMSYDPMASLDWSSFRLFRFWTVSQQNMTPLPNKLFRTPMYDISHNLSYIMPLNL